MTELNSQTSSNVTFNTTKTKRSLHQRVFDHVKKIPLRHRYNACSEALEEEQQQTKKNEIDMSNDLNVEKTPVSKSTTVLLSTQSTTRSHRSLVSLSSKRNKTGPPPEAVRRTSAYANHENNHIDTGIRGMHVEEASAIQVNPLPPRPLNPVYGLPPDLCTTSAIRQAQA